jgi:hypothetical protein
VDASGRSTFEPSRERVETPENKQNHETKDFCDGVAFLRQVPVEARAMTLADPTFPQELFR